MPPSRYSTSTSSETAHTINNINRSYQGEEAHLTIVSADGVRFKVDKWRLKAASSVFRNMLAFPVKVTEHKDVLTLYDNQIEDGRSVKIFLDLLYGGTLPDADWAKCYLLLGALKMVQKYDCVHIRGLAVYALRNALHHPQACSIYIFIAAAIVNDIDTCKQSILVPLSVPLSPSPESLLGEDPFQCQGGHPKSFDPRALTFEMQYMIPPDYCFAMMRASLKTDIAAREPLAGRRMKRTERIRFAHEFATVMGQMRARNTHLVRALK